MTSHVAFESQREKQRCREQRRQEREAVLAKAEANFHKREEKKRQAELLGEGSWMLPSIDERITNEEKAIKDSLSKADKKKHKKDKKHKKKHHKPSSDNSDSEPDSPVWVEKKQDADMAKTKTIGPKLERESWMMGDFSFKTVPDKASRKKDTAKSSEDVDMLDKPGQHRLEMNPYWKNGGCGMPETGPSTVSVAKNISGDGGLSWLQKALRRCVEMAKEEGRSVEAVAAERYGSLEELKAKIQAAEESQKRMKTKEESHARDQYRSNISKKIAGSFLKPKDDDSDEAKSQKSHSAESQTCSQHEYGLENRSKSWRKPDSKSSRNVDSKRQKRGNEYYETEQCKSKSELAHDSEKSELKQSKFLKPDEATENQLIRSKGKTSRSSDSEETEDEDDDVVKKHVSESEEEASAPPLTEQEMNHIGAQIVRAEILGNEALAQKLKKQLADAQKMKDARAADTLKARNTTQKLIAKEEDKVLLTRTDRCGMTRPLPGQKNLVEATQQRRKRKLSNTHDSSGKREKYFADDDKYSLQNLVEREKLSTAEDTDLMFARLAGKAARGTDEDMDDNMVDSAAVKQSASLMESRERQIAIIEHKKMSASLDKCQLCFSNVPKHLIIAIGAKVYLSLPKYRSMTDGHCLITPIQHVTQGTNCDEDVWEEIQIFRKSLTRMFKDLDRDCVFMETSMNLHRYPHLVIECVPLDKEVGEMAPIYFKKALQECESEWAQNKKIVDLSQKSVRQAVPKGFPYFAVDFGLQGGYAHVVENEKSFASYFGREVVGGMLDLDPTFWRRPHNESFEEQRKKVLKFADEWKVYDWTQKLKIN